MSFNLTANKGGDGAAREKIAAGNHPAVLVALIDLGSQHHEYKGEAKWVRDVYLVFEFPTKKATTGKSHLLAETVTLSLNEKAKLRKWAEAMVGAKIADGAGFDVTALLGKPCLLNVLHSEKGYPRVEGVGGYPEGLPAPTPTLPFFACSLDEFKADKKQIPEWVPWAWSRALGKMASIPEHVAACKELGGRATAEPEAGYAGPKAGATSDDPIPF